MPPQGKIIKYEEVLDEFYEKYQGKRKEIVTELRQIPTKENGYVAISFATVSVYDRETGKIFAGPFTGIGDASERNVPNQSVALHMIRVSETRAKSRALKDATNIKGTFSDDPDIGEIEAQPAAPHPDRVQGVQKGGAAPAQAPAQQAAPKRGTVKEETLELLTAAIADWDSGQGIARVERRANKTLEEMSEEDAQSWLARVSTFLEEAQAPAQAQAETPAGEEDNELSLEEPPF